MVTARFQRRLEHAMPVGLVALIASVALAATGPALAAPPVASDATMPDLTLDELMNLEVTSVSKRRQRLYDTASAVYVITSEDIRRSGHASIPEALRLAPGLHVARATTGSWEITARGFNGAFANKLLVMIDGRSVYTPLFSGVWWDIQDMPLEDVDRIEVIRGPGASMWGANAVNGVINIIRKRPEDQQGSYASALGGTETRLITSFGHGGRLGDDVAFRISGRHRDLDESVDRDGHAGVDDLALQTLGGRFDWTASDRDEVTLQGDWYNGDAGQVARIDNAGSLATGIPVGLPSVPQDLNGGNALIRWTRTFSETSALELQAYWSRRARDNGFLDEHRSDYDIELMHRLRLGSRHDVVWGGGARHLRDTIDSTFNVAFRPGRNAEAIYNAFVQDEFRLLDDLRLTFGTKVEWNTYTSWEIQPSVRGLWTPAERHQVWAAVSRAARTPSRAEREASVIFGVVPPPPIAAPVTFMGNLHFESEYLTAFELGYRTQPTDDLTLDFALFYNDYENMLELFPTGPLPTITTAMNSQEFFAYGLEAAANWQVNDTWRLSGNYTGYKRQGGSPDEVSVPRHQFQVHSYLDLPHDLSLDTGVYYQGRVRRGALGGNIRVRSHWRWDTRLAWRPRDGLELSLVAQDLFDRRHKEGLSFFQEFASEDQYIERNFYGQVRIEF